MARHERMTAFLTLTIVSLLVPTTATAESNKVQICHFPPGNMDGYHTISVGEAAADAHVSNHPFDFLGECCEGFDDCDDGDPCTADVCHGFCAYEPADCSDGNLCTVDSCDSSTGCVNEPIFCPSDSDNCTVDACEPTTGQCVSEVRPCTSADDCDDGNLCTRANCDSSGLCGEQGSGFCSTGSVLCPLMTCQIQSCDPLQGCVYEPKCQDTDPCTVDICDPISTNCMFDPLCDDFDSCTVDICDPSGPMCENVEILECILECPCWSAGDILNTFGPGSICTDLGFFVGIEDATSTTRFSVALKGTFFNQKFNIVTRIENNVTTCKEELRCPPDDSNRAEALLCADLLRSSSICSP